MQMAAKVFPALISFFLFNTRALFLSVYLFTFNCCNLYLSIPTGDSSDRKGEKRMNDDDDLRDRKGFGGMISDNHVLYSTLTPSRSPQPLFQVVAGGASAKEATS